MIVELNVLIAQGFHSLLTLKCCQEKIWCSNSDLRNSVTVRAILSLACRDEVFVIVTSPKILPSYLNSRTRHGTPTMAPRSCLGVLVSADLVAKSHIASWNRLSLDLVGYTKSSESKASVEIYPWPLSRSTAGCYLVGVTG